MRNLRGPEFKQIATPNNDTLYAQAFCDLSREPIVLSVLRVDSKRYDCMQLWIRTATPFIMSAAGPLDALPRKARGSHRL